MCPPLARKGPSHCDSTKAPKHFTIRPVLAAPGRWSKSQAKMGRGNMSSLLLFLPTLLPSTLTRALGTPLIFPVSGMFQWKQPGAWIWVRWDDYRLDSDVLQWRYNLFPHICPLFLSALISHLYSLIPSFPPLLQQSKPDLNFTCLSNEIL